ncbi:tyrosine-type recombinase/integrase [Bacteroides heparinolyticus]|uniref:tyrosine-type recombinase/integrase n=1 Tax=Prevotella heparinolytica TaxID=28113 RepID=UPI003AF11A8B
MILARLERRGEKVRLEALKELSIPKDESAAVYLSMQEIERINALHLHKDSAQVRDIFIVGCLTGLRYSDYSRLSEDNFVNSNIDILTKKTNTRVVIPVHPLIDDLIARNNGYGFLRYNKSQQNFNMRIKYICKKAGINEKVHYECTEGFRRVKHTKRKYELISSHTARRSCATNMYLSGIPTARIMLITGHKTESAFFTYIRIRKEENAEELRAHPFFSR